MTRSVLQPRTLFLAFALLAGGCSSMTPGNVAVVQPHSDSPRAGNVYLLRGWIGIFSYGINNLGTEINQNGVRANVFQDDQWSALAAAIRQKYAGVKNPEPLILVGHSFGADDVIRVARELSEDKITVDLVVTLDAVSPPEVPANVRHCYNLYQSNKLWDGVPMFRGVPVKAASGSLAKVDNGDVRTNRTDLLEPRIDHFNIEKKPKIHADVIQQILAICPPRQAWAQTHHLSPGVAARLEGALIRPMVQPNESMSDTKAAGSMDGTGRNPVSSSAVPAATGAASHARRSLE